MQTGERAKNSVVFFSVDRAREKNQPIIPLSFCCTLSAPQSMGRRLPDQPVAAALSPGHTAPHAEGQHIMLDLRAARAWPAEAIARAMLAGRGTTDGVPLEANVATSSAPLSAPQRSASQASARSLGLNSNPSSGCTTVFRFIKAHALAHLTPDNPRLAVVLSTSPQLRSRSSSLSRPFLSSLFLSLSASLCLPACLSVSVPACLFCVCACARSPCVRLMIHIVFRIDV